MSTTTPGYLPPASYAAPMTLEGLNDWRADAARYTVFNRMMPALRHDVLPRTAELRRYLDGRRVLKAPYRR